MLASWGHNHNRCDGLSDYRTHSKCKLGHGKIAKASKTKAKNHTGEQPEQTTETNAPSFEHAPLGRSVILAACTLLRLISSIRACQHSYIKHFAELACNEEGQRHQEYSQELLFNRLQLEICLEILHTNNTVGLIKITKRSVELKARKSQSSL